MHRAHGEVAVVEVRRDALAAVGADAERRAPRSHHAGERELARQLAADVDALGLAVPAGGDVLPLLRFDQTRRAVVQRFLLEFAAACSGERDPVPAEKDPDPAALRVVVLREQALPAAQAERANPALERQLLEPPPGGQTVGHVHVGAGVDRLRLRLVDLEGFQHRILVAVLRVGAEPHHAQLVGHAAADAEVDLLAGGDTLLRVGVQAGQIDSLVRRDLLRPPVGDTRRGQFRRFQIGDQVGDLGRLEQPVEGLRHQRDVRVLRLSDVL